MPDIDDVRILNNELSVMVENSGSLCNEPLMPFPTIYCSYPPDTADQSACPCFVTMCIAKCTARCSAVFAAVCRAI